MIDKRLWFYKDNSELCKKHREAYEKSLNCNHAVKVHSKMYYYKGYEVSASEERIAKYRWGYVKVSYYPEDMEVCNSKAEAMMNIDGIIEFENNNKEE